MSNPTTPSSSAAADWYPDPLGRHEFRYWDGSAWTDNVSSHGTTSIDPVEGRAPKSVPGGASPGRVNRQVERHFANAERRGATVDRDVLAGGALLDQRILVVNQKAKLIEVNQEFIVHDRDGNRIGYVRQVGQNAFKKVLRFLGSWDQFFTHKLQILDQNHNVVLALTRPAKFFKSRVIVANELGNEIGVIRQNNVFGKISFDIEAGPAVIGKIQAENWRAWNFAILDSQGHEVARITKTFEGILKTAFTTADNYVVQVHQELTDPMRQMVMASALTIDTALKQDARGLGSGSLFDLFGN